MKNLQNLKGAKALNKQELRSINGGHSFTFSCYDGTTWTTEASSWSRGRTIAVEHCHSHGGTQSLWCFGCAHE